MMDRVSVNLASVMSAVSLIKLRPTGPWRIGPDSGDRDRVDRIYHSDSLYSAVSGAMSRLGELDSWLDATARAPPNPPSDSVRAFRSTATRFMLCLRAMCGLRRRRRRCA